MEKHIRILKRVGTGTLKPPAGSSQIEKKSAHNLKNGILYLKGGDLKEELSTVKQKHRIYSLSDYFEEPFFETKKVVHVELN